jgi:uncharacterized protein GlcG (DUF336 family)
MHALAAGIAKANELGAPENITIVDDGGNLLGFVRMDGARTFSAMTSHKKAMSAASHRQPSGRLDPANELKFAAATGGGLTNLEGGFPILFDRLCVGGIGVGSGTGAQDCEVARAMLAALGAQPF